MLGSVQLSPALSPPRHRVTRNPGETCRAREGPSTQEHTHKSTHMHTRFHFIPPWVMGFLTICLILSTNKTRARGLLRQCNPTLEWVWTHWIAHTCVLSGLYMSKCSRKLFAYWISSHKNTSSILKKTLSFSSSVRVTRSPTKVPFFHLLPIFPLPLQATSSGQEVWKAIFALEPFTAPSSSSPSSSWRHGRMLEGGFAARPTWRAASPPHPPLVVVTNAVRHGFVPRRPPTTATAWKDITIQRSRLNNGSFQTPLCAA